MTPPTRGYADPAAAATRIEGLEDALTRAQKETQRLELQLEVVRRSKAEMRAGYRSELRREAERVEQAKALAEVAEREGLATKGKLKEANRGADAARKELKDARRTIRALEARLGERAATARDAAPGDLIGWDASDNEAGGGSSVSSSVEDDLASLAAPAPVVPGVPGDTARAAQDDKPSMTGDGAKRPHAALHGASYGTGPRAIVKFLEAMLAKHTARAAELGVVGEGMSANMDTLRFMIREAASRAEEIEARLAVALAQQALAASAAAESAQPAQSAESTQEAVREPEQVQEKTQQSPTKAKAKTETPAPVSGRQQPASGAPTAVRRQRFIYSQIGLVPVTAPVNPSSKSSGTPEHVLVTRPRTGSPALPSVSYHRTTTADLPATFESDDEGGSGKLSQSAASSVSEVSFLVPIADETPEALARTAKALSSNEPAKAETAPGSAAQGSIVISGPCTAYAPRPARGLPRFRPSGPCGSYGAPAPLRPPLSASEPAEEEGEVVLQITFESEAAYRLWRARTGHAAHESAPRPLQPIEGLRPGSPPAEPAAAEDTATAEGPAPGRARGL